MKGYYRISKSDFYAYGGFSNPDLFRKMIGNVWVHYRINTDS